VGVSGSITSGPLHFALQLLLLRATPGQAAFPEREPLALGLVGTDIFIDYLSVPSRNLDEYLKRLSIFVQLTYFSENYSRLCWVPHRPAKEKMWTVMKCFAGRMLFLSHNQQCQSTEAVGRVERRRSAFSQVNRLAVVLKVGI